MAEAVVSVLGKLAVVIANEAKFLGGVGKKVERVQRELTRIKCCLIDADSKRKGDARVQNWLNELRNVAYRIEDAIDTFFLKVGYAGASVLQKFMRECKKPMNLHTLHNLGTELDNIENQLKEIYESRLHYDIKLDQPVEDKSKGSEAVKMRHRTATYSEVDENQVVGMQAHKENIMKMLHLEQTTKLAVITIVGTGGLGKTTLACMIYKSAKEDFNYHINLPISQQFNMRDLLTKMVSEYNKEVPKDRDVGYYVGELKSFLSSKRYLIVLDDVWQEDLWNELKDVLPNSNKNGSRVLITSRSIKVEKSAEYQTIQYELKILDDEKSLDLLLKKAFPYQDPDKEYPTDLLELADKLSKKCNGLPLALVVLGGILSKEQSYPKWERIFQNMNWHSDGMDCMKILAMSYKDLPYYLKACFQYLAFFPEDYVIAAKNLIRMWVAEGFIPPEGKTTIEIMAEDCVEELAKRSLVQVLSRSTNGLIKNIKVHDILRDLAMNEAGHENFVTVFSQTSADNKPDRIIRRVSLQAQERNSQFIEYVGPNTRSLFLFDRDGYFKTGLHCSNFRLLKVLEIVGRKWDKIVLKSLDELIHLKFLRLRNCRIKRSSFHGMKSLETLELRGLGYKKFDGLWTISTLRHILVDYGEDIRGPIPKGTRISNLQTLKWFQLERGEALCDVKLPNLRKLGIQNRSGEWASITNLLQTLPLLVSLWIDVDWGEDLPMEIVYPKSLLNYQNLQSLYLDGKWPKNVNIEARLLPQHLVKLSLRNTCLNYNPMLELGKLNGLKKLRLGYAAFDENWEGPINCLKGFPVLQYLKVYDTDCSKYGVPPAIMDLTVEEGVMPNLIYLQVRHGIKVQLPLKLQHVRVHEM